jgi:thymidine kinase
VAGGITLAQVAEKMAMLEIACNKCGRYGRLGVQNLIAAHGADMDLPNLKDMLAKGCPRLENPRYDDRCHAHFPQLPKVF